MQKERGKAFLRSFKVSYIFVILIFFTLILWGAFSFFMHSRLAEMDNTLSNIYTLISFNNDQKKPNVPQLLHPTVEIQLYDDDFTLMKSSNPYGDLVKLPQIIERYIRKGVSTESLSINAKNMQIERDALLCMPLYKDLEASYIYRVRIQKIKNSEGQRKKNYYVVLTSPMKSFFQLKFSLYAVFSLIMGAFIIFMCWHIFLITSTNKELLTLKKAIKSIDLKGNMRIFISKQVKNPHIEGIATELNSLFSRIEEAVNGLLTFTADASHELRTPLAIIKGIVDVTLLKTRDVAYYERKLRELAAHADKMQSLLTALLEMARLETSGEQMKMEPLELMVIGEEVASSLKPIWESKKQTLELRLNPAPIKGNEALINQLVTNLLDNASKYTQHGGHIKLITDHDIRNNKAVLEVWDTGIGMDKETINKCFNRLWRAEKSRTAPGYGIGLSLGLRIIKIHKGQIEIESEPNKGTKIKILFPLDLTSFEAYGLS